MSLFILQVQMYVENICYKKPKANIPITHKNSSNMSVSIVLQTRTLKPVISFAHLPRKHDKNRLVMMGVTDCINNRLQARKTGCRRVSLCFSGGVEEGDCQPVVNDMGVGWGWGGGG